MEISFKLLSQISYF